MQEIHPHCLYRHFKGKLYYVVGIAAYVTGGKYVENVVYHALYGENEMYTRTKEDFLAEIPENKVNPTGQKYRFELAQYI